MKLKDKFTITLTYECNSVNESIDAGKTCYFRLVSDDCGIITEKVLKITDDKIEKLLKARKICINGGTT